MNRIRCCREARRRTAVALWLRRRAGGLRDDERGSGSILAVAILAAMLSLFAMSTPLYCVLAAKHRAAAAADAAALAGAAVALGITTGLPCDVAAAVAAANGATLGRCTPDGVIVTVRVTVTAMGIAARAAATAGPPVEPAQ